jgi:hypothetical protein
MRIASAPEAAASTLSRYQLDVIAASASDVVRAAGGWLFDRAMAGGSRWYPAYQADLLPIC